MDRRQFMNRSALALIGSSLMACSDRNKFRLRKNQVIGCFGDSITNAGGNGYVERLQAKFDQDNADLNLKFLNYGKSSETVTGLTEEDHPGPRPYLFERLDDILEKTPLDIALFCYGINCGIYGKPSKKLFNSYKIGVYSFLEKMRQRDIGTVLLTTPPLVLDAVPTSKTHTSESYGYKNPYPNYEDEVLQEFKQIITQLQHPFAKAKVDIHTPLFKNRMECYDNDPIHPNQKGHELIADTIIGKIAF